MIVANNYIFGRAYLDPLVKSYIAVNGETNPIIIGYLDTFAKGLRSDGLIPKIQAFWFFYDTATKSRINFMNPSLYVGTFVGTPTITTNGWVNSAYLKTGFIPSSVQALNSNGLGLTSGTNYTPGNDQVDIGCLNSLIKASVISLKNFENSGNHAIRLNGEVLSSANTDARGIFISSRTSATVCKLFKNGVSIISGSSGGTLPNVEIFVRALSLSGSVYGASNQRIQNAFMIEGLSDSDVALLNNRIDILENALGRKTW